MSEESKQKISKRMSEIRKISNPMKGRTGELHHNFGKPMSEEQKKKISDSRKGIPSGFKGKHHTEEAKQKNADAHKGKPTWNKGLETGPHSEEHNQNISTSILKWWEELPEEVKIERNNKISRSKEHLSPHIGCCGSEYKTKENETIWLRSSYEVRVAKKLDELNVTWEYESKSFDIGGRYYHPDFYLPEYDIWWEVKGYLSDADRIKMNKFYEMYLDETLKLIFLDDIKLLETIDNISDVSLAEFGNDMCDFTL